MINATGPFTDSILQKAHPHSEPIVVPSAGVHIILPNYYSPRNMGLIDPATKDGRVIFFLPWQGSTIAGTTDSPTNITDNPRPTEEEINWILSEIRGYLGSDVQVKREDVLSAWSGIRPLVKDPHAKKSTQALVRNHLILTGEDGLLTIAGGKWTTYRAMAEETVDAALSLFDLSASKCVTADLPLVGSDTYSHSLFARLAQRFDLDTDVAIHLAGSYGDRSFAVAELAAPTGKRWPKAGKRLAEAYPYLEAEVRWAVRAEMACSAVDVIARRTRLAFLNAEAAREALPRVVEIMAEELGWTEQRCQEELLKGKQFLRYMGRWGTKRTDVEG